MRFGAFLTGFSILIFALFVAGTSIHYNYEKIKISGVR